MKSIKDEILDVVSFLRERPLVVYSGEKDYYSCKIFLEGYFYGMEYTRQIKIFDDIRIWLSDQVNIKLNTSWTDYPKFFLES
jgi:hypothetical protein